MTATNGTPKLKGPAQIEAMGELTQGAAAWLLNRTTRVLRDQGAPRTASGRYDAQKLVAWAIDWATGRAAPEEVASTALEDERAERAAIRRLERRKLEGELIERESVEAFLLRLAALLRGAGEQLQRLHGKEAGLILEEALDEAEREMEKFGEAV